MEDFYVPTKELDAIFDFELLEKTLEVDDELLVKLFEMVTYSIPDMSDLKQIITNGIINVKIRVRSTFQLIGMLCFNYRNFIRIIQLIDFYLDQENYKGSSENKPHIIGYASTIDGEGFPSIEKCFSSLHMLFSGLVLTLIQSNYAANYFININTDN